MTTLDRRRFLLASGAVAGAGLAARPSALLARTAADPVGKAPTVLPSNPFTLGVASGDPLPDAVVLWTRLALDPVNGGGMPPGDVAVSWEVANDIGFTDIVASGSANATGAYAHSVHVDATGLAPDRAYFYRFGADGFTSTVGRTRTAPAAGAAPSSVRFGFASCQSYTNGYYTAHAHLAQESLDVVFWLGDYIYENAGSGIRAHNGGECFTLDDYRNRYGLYKSDGDLQAAHAAFPWVVIWDDHETDNNYAGPYHSGGDPVDQFLLRRAAAYQAWWEHQPVRLAPPVGPDLQIYRSFSWGTLARFFALDGRQYRSDQTCGTALVSVCAEQYDPSRQMLGPAQESWLIDGLRASPARWNVLANQTVFSALPFAGSYNQDQWDGYPAARQRIIDVLAEQAVQNPLVITGDIHAAGIGDVHLVPEDATSPRVATELVGTAITSSFNTQLAPVVEQLVSALPWSHYVNAHDHGYTVVEVTATNAHADFRVVSTIEQRQATLATDMSYDVAAVVKAAPATPVPVAPAFTG